MSLKRKSVGLVNTDKNAYLRAKSIKQEKKRTIELQNKVIELENRINTLEKLFSKD